MNAIEFVKELKKANNTKPIKVDAPDGYPKVEIYASVNLYNQKGEVNE